MEDEEEKMKEDAGRVDAMEEAVHSSGKEKSTTTPSSSKLLADERSNS